jgi:hypothetical protein
MNRLKTSIKKYLIEQISDEWVSIEDAWDMFIDVHFEWMLEELADQGLLPQGYDEKYMKTYFEFMKKYMMDNIYDDIKHGYFDDEFDHTPKGLGFNQEELDASYGLFKQKVKEKF